MSVPLSERPFLCDITGKQRGKQFVDSDLVDFLSGSKDSAINFNSPLANRVTTKRVTEKKFKGQKENKIKYKQQGKLEGSNEI